MQLCLEVWYRTATDLETTWGSASKENNGDSIHHMNRLLRIILLENVEHCGGEPEQADTGYYVIDR